MLAVIPGSGGKAVAAVKGAALCVVAAAVGVLGGCGSKSDQDQSLQNGTLRIPAIEDYVITGGEGGIVEDLRTGLQWMRCSVGQVWNGRTCRDWAVWDCESAVLGTAQSCSLLNPEAGTWWIKLEGIENYAEVDLSAQVTVQNGDQDGSVTTFELLTESDVTDAAGSARFFGLNVPANTVYLDVATSTGTGQLALLVRRGDQIELPTLSWAEVQALAVSYGGYSDWRLPTVQELNTLIYCSSAQRAEFDENGIGGHCVGTFQRPTIRLSVFPNTPVKSFWTVSGYYYFDEFAWSVHFDTGAVGSPGVSASRHVRLVRGGL